MNNTTHLVHLWQLPLLGFRHFLAIMSPYKPQTRGPVRAHLRPYVFATDWQIRTPNLLHHQATSQAHTFTHTHTAQYFYSTPWIERQGFASKKALLRCLLLRVDQNPLLPTEADLNLNSGSYQFDEWGSQVSSQTFLGFFVHPELTSSTCWERGSPHPGSTQSHGAW
jgi:hypothetical protein